MIDLFEILDFTDEEIETLKEVLLGGDIEEDLGDE